MSSSFQCLLSFFAPSLPDVDSLRANFFFLLYHGNGFTRQDIGKMTWQEFESHSNRLYDTKMEERRQQEEQARKAKAKRKK